MEEVRALLEKHHVPPIEVESILKAKQLDKSRDWLVLTHFRLLLVKRGRKPPKGYFWHTAKRFRKTRDREVEFEFNDGTIPVKDTEAEDLLVRASQHVISIFTEEEFPRERLEFNRQDLMYGYGKNRDAVFLRMKYQAFVQKRRNSPNFKKALKSYVRACMDGRSNVMDLEHVAKYVSKFWLVFDGLLMCDNIKTLIVPNKGKDVWFALGHFVRHNETVERLVIKANPNSEPVDDPECETRGNCPKSNGLEKFACSFSQNKNCKVKAIEFKGNVYDSNFAVKMAIVAESVPLTTWTVQTGFNRSGMETVMQMFTGGVRGFQHLVKLDFVQCDGIQCDKLLVLQSLKLLQVTDSSVDLADMFEALDKHQDTRLAKIVLSGNVCQKELRDDLKLPPKLRVLVLNRVKWYRDSLIRFFRICGNDARKMYGKMIVSLNSVIMDEPEWKAFNEFADVCHTDPFHAINFNGNPLSPELLNYFLRLSNLGGLRINGCVHDDDADLVRILLERLPANTQLSCLCIRGSNKKYLCESLFKLLHALIPNTTIKCLDVGHHKAGSEIVPAITELLLHNTTLESIMFDDNNIDSPDSLFQMTRELKAAPSPRQMALQPPVHDISRMLSQRLMTMSQARRLHNEMMALYHAPSKEPAKPVVKPPPLPNVHVSDPEMNEGIEVPLAPDARQETRLPLMYQVKIDRLNEEYITDHQWESLLNYIPEPRADFGRRAAYDISLSSIAYQLAL